MSRLGEVEEIVRQTDLRALNAGTQAARAKGEDRGLAVVADEVRRLAEMSRQLAASIPARASRNVDQAERAGHHRRAPTRTTW